MRISKGWTHVVDSERLNRLLARIEQDVAGVRSDAADTDLAVDDRALRAVKYGFVLAIKGCMRAAQHIVTSEGLGRPESNADAVRPLGRAGLVPEPVAEPVARAVGFRNLLVDEYAEVDDDQVRDNVALLPDIDAFVQALADRVIRQQ